MLYVTKSCLLSTDFLNDFRWTRRFFLVFLPLMKLCNVLWLNWALSRFSDSNYFVHITQASNLYAILAIFDLQLPILANSSWFFNQLNWLQTDLSSTRSNFSMTLPKFSAILLFSHFCLRFSGPEQTSVVAGNMADSDGGGAASAAPKGGKKRISQIYQKKSQLEHILLRPDTYIGSVQVWGVHLLILSLSCFSLFG